MKVRNNMAKVLAVGLALSQTFTAFAADLPTNTSVSSETNAASGNSKVILDNKYWYKVQLPGIIDLKFDETTQSYKEEFDINVAGQVPGKMLQIDTNDVEMTGTDDITVGNYVGQYNKGERNHTYIYGSGEGDTDLTPEWAAIKSGADISAYGVKAGNYDGTAAYKFKLVDPSAANGSQIQLEDSKLVMGAGQSHQIEATLDGKDVTSDINWTSDNESIAKVTKSGNVVVSANAKSGDVVEISGTLPADYNEKETASILNSLSNAFGPMVVHAAGTEKTISFTVSIVEINFDDTLTSIDKIELLPGEEMKVRAIIEPETEGTVSWSATRATGLGLSKKGNYCTISIADDMPEGETFELIATYGDYSKKLPVVIKSRHTHVAGEPVKENIVAATCETAGSYDEVIYCTDTDTTEMSRKNVTVPALGHDWDEWKDENGVQVRYCKNDDTHKETGSLTSYKITYELDGGSMSGQKTSYTKEDSFTLPVPTKDGYKFVGWTGSNGTTAQESVTIDAGTTGDLKYVAKWEVEIKAGLYNSNDELLVTWDNLVKETGFNVENTKDKSGLSNNTFYNMVLKNKMYTDCKKIIIPDSVTKIDDKAFYWCQNIEYIKIPDSVTSVGIGAFQECYKLVTVNIPNGVTRLEQNTFYNCYRLKQLVIPKTVTDISSNVFTGVGDYYKNSGITINTPNIIVEEDTKTWYGRDLSTSKKTKITDGNLTKYLNDEKNVKYKSFIFSTDPR